MRIRNVKNKEEILNNSKYLISNPKDYVNKWNNLFGNDNPIYIEIGMGKGKFIIENAKKYKDINFIGIECQDSIIAKSLLKLEDIELSNLKIVRMNALIIDEVFNHEVSRIYLNFSDPWPKKRHHFRRLTSNIFLDKYDSIFRNDKDIYLRTDNSGLYTYSIETLSNHGYRLKEVSLDLHKDSEEELITTEYEDRFSSENKPIYSLIATTKTVQNSK